jgi:2-polyprenyl-6-methoxyphenol hydroxylase-like FAD-dependent oxidoreductase
MGAAERIDVDCCIAGGGPAGMMLGYLLARAGINVLVLEKHADFRRDFHGDTVHPSTLDVLGELGLLERLLAISHQKMDCHFIALTPQRDFLGFIAEEARSYETFQLRMRAKALDLVETGGRILGLRAETEQGLIEVRASLVVGADGRGSAVREGAGLDLEKLGSPVDVLWTKLSKRPGDPPQTEGYFDFGRALVLLDRGDCWQCGMVIRNGELEEIRARGLPTFRANIARLAPSLADRAEEITNWAAVKLLTVRMTRLRQWWRPGLLCIGDAAHAMSPIGGVGINLAIQDAVAAANILTPSLRAGWVADRRLAAVQRRRALPTRVTQELQIFVQRRIWRRGPAEARARLPVSLRLFNRFPWLRRVPAYLIGVGVRPEHVALAA